MMLSPPPTTAGANHVDHSDDSPDERSSLHRRVLRQAIRERNQRDGHEVIERAGSA